NFLKEGNKVKAYVQFKGRAIQFKERGELVLLKFAERLKEIGQVEGLPKLEGKRMLMIIAPKSAKKKKEA
ncbi:MAG TPA: translation initiation factor IF-3 C-terminal domain-containing protein, partial [Lacibacter sp.]|nr:translation initiation factor IF-3 C-terminal domain-containing protein [Lacibacter sp.]